MNNLNMASGPTRLAVAGLVVAAAGVLIQYATLPEDFPTIPPGPIILGSALVVALVPGGGGNNGRFPQP